MDPKELFKWFMRDEAEEIKRHIESSGRDDTDEAIHEWIWANSESFRQSWFFDHT